jgi:hypothetical protein
MPPSDGLLQFLQLPHNETKAGSALTVLDPMIAGPEGGPSSDMQRYGG